MMEQKLSEPARCPDCAGSEFPGFKRGVRCTTCKGTATTPDAPVAAALPDLHQQIMNLKYGKSEPARFEHAQWYAVGHTDARHAAAELVAGAVAAPSCKKCGGAMKPGKAMGQTVYQADEGTCSPAGPGFLTDCMKCSACGWSVSAAPSGGVPADTLYAECRECSNCGHAGINDAHPTDAACNTCQWRGPSPKEDRCPECQREGTMTDACPKCGCGKYTFVANAELPLLAAAGAPTKTEPQE